MGFLTMQMNTNPTVNRFDQGIVRNDNKGKQALNTNAPATDQVMDLTQTENLNQELNTKDVSFIRIQEKEEDIFLDVTKMPPEEKDALIADLKHKVSGAAKYDDFDPESFFKLVDNQLLKVGEPMPPGTTPIKIKSAQDVLNQSITGKTPEQKQIFEFMNGDETALHKKDAQSHVGNQAKPAEWYNGFQVEKNEQGEYTVSTHQSDFDKAADAAEGKTTPPYDLNTQGYAGKKGIDAYQAMLKTDFNFNGAVKDLRVQADKEIKASPEAAAYASMNPQERKEVRDAKAEALFTESVVKKFSPKHPNLNDEQLKLLSKNVWSYATTGADAQGKIDIGEMQSMLNQLDPEMVKSGSNNAKSSYGKFTIKGEDGTSLTLPKGDPYHGRGTILQTRHLIESFRAEPTTYLSFKTPPPELQGYKNTIMLADHSLSMGQHMQNLSGVIEAGGIEGKVTVGTFIDKDKPMVWSDQQGNESTNPVPLAASQADDLLQTQGDAHVAFVRSLRDTPPEDAAASSGVGSAFDFGRGQSMHESGILAGIQALNNPNIQGDQGEHGNQLVLFTDETDSSTPEDLRELQRLADEKGYDVKVLFTKGEETFSIIPLNSLDASSAPWNGNQGGVSNTLNWSALTSDLPNYRWSDTGI